MTIVKRISILLMLITMSLGINAGVKPTRIYAFGVATSFNDSTVYITEIMPVDSAWVNEKTKFLYSRENYSYQLKLHLVEQGKKNITTTVFYNEKSATIEKKYLKIKKRFTSKSGYDIKYITPSEFQFTAVSAE